MTGAIANGANIQLTADIQLDSYLDIDGKTVTIDLNGHSLSRHLSDYDHAGHVIWAHNGSTLTLTSTAEGNGIIEGGMANNGGAIHIPHGNTVSATNVTFRNNTAREHAGAIWNNGTFTATNCTFTGNSCTDVGAIYNAVQTDDNVTYAGTATLTNCTITGNWGTTGAGALANAVGNTEMTIDGCTIQDNTAGSRGGGIWNGGTLNMKGKVIVTDNQKESGVGSNVFLKSGTVITLTGSLLEGSSIGVEIEGFGTFTSGYSTYHNNVDPQTFFTSDLNVITELILLNNEACDRKTGYEYFVERSWDGTNKKVVSTLKGLTDGIDYNNNPTEEGHYKEVTNDPDEWFVMGGYSTTLPEYYVVHGNVERKTIVVEGKNVHLILCDGAKLTLTGGLKLEDDHKLYIHSQSYGNEMGQLIVTNSYSNAAGIGSARDVNGKSKKVGELVIYGGHIEATGAAYAAGIGSCAEAKGSHIPSLCNKVTVFGGYVKATGGESGAGIGGGSGDDLVIVEGGTFVMYDGTVIAQGGKLAAGIGGGGSRSPAFLLSNSSSPGGDGGDVTIYGGTLTATGGENGAGIGSGNGTISHTLSLYGGNVNIYGGTVTANGGKNAAGIGGGHYSGGPKLTIYNGTVTANGGEYGAGVGGGDKGRAGFFKMLNGTLTSIGGKGAAGIGGGYEGKFGDYSDETIEILGGTVIAKAGELGGGKGNRAIGSGQNQTTFGRLTLAPSLMVAAGYSEASDIFVAEQREIACRYYACAKISPCTHPAGITYTINEDDTHTSHTHTSHCKNCAVSETAAHVNSDGNGTCVCGYKGGGTYFTITLATSNNGTSYEGVGELVNVGNNKLYTLPVCSTIPDGYDFVGWVVSPSSQANGILPNEGETLKQAGEDITVENSVSIFARYRTLEISLADNSDNSETLDTYNGRKDASVTLTGRTLYKDGNWNTLCLPFDIDDIAHSPLADYSGLMTLDVTSTEDDGVTKKTRLDGTTLNLWFADATSIKAGVPYIIKWADNGANNLTETDLVFSNVEISNALTKVESADGTITFVGTYCPLAYTETEQDVLFLGVGNKLYYPQPSTGSTLTIGAQRAYFQLNNGITAGESNDQNTQNGQSQVRAFVLNFGNDETTGETTGIVDVDLKYTSQESGISNSLQHVWFTLDGRRLSGKPTTKGLYINNGKKTVIK